jgi:hypothetical protein
MRLFSVNHIILEKFLHQSLFFIPSSQKSTGFFFATLHPRYLLNPVFKTSKKLRERDQPPKSLINRLTD